MSCTADRTLDPEAFRALIRTHGQKVRYWRAIPCPCNYLQGAEYSRTCPHHDRYGFIYEEIAIPSHVRAYIYSSSSRVLHPDLGWIKATTTMVQTMPDEIYLHTGDKLLSTQAQLAARETRKRGSGRFDELSQLHVSGIDALIVQGDQFEQGTDYRLDVDPATGKSRIEWVGTAPVNGTVYSVLYQYNPLFWVVGGSMTPPRPSQYQGKPLVQRSELSLKHPSEAE